MAKVLGPTASFAMIHWPESDECTWLYPEALKCSAPSVSMHQSKAAQRTWDVRPISLSKYMWNIVERLNSKQGPYTHKCCYNALATQALDWAYIPCPVSQESLSSFEDRWPWSVCHTFRVCVYNDLVLVYHGITWNAPLTETFDISYTSKARTREMATSIGRGTHLTK